ncbi:flagellar motor switch protein FliN/FliY [Sporobacter termitidis DSM 10068]|uniref:Flagellar motor switch protein FliN/FliY n=1 Tax=Sporobacter termitidis DSM 10068 TaxID=1123282 RepID=A0A1M5W808_9FIRM|nr:flagellar motor switch phosphatase FliY [Sporobacter termitidis]SHH83610.1 flagellar motor switch protein FliN/FliY [Sporobacter termitidis DSM 10068]
MSDLTQEEIDALISGGKTASTQEMLAEDEKDIQTFEELDAQAQEDITGYFTPDQIDALGEVGNICMGTSATTMYALLGRRVNITTPKVGLYKAENVLSAFQWPFLAISVEFTEGVFGKNLLIMKDYDAAVITDLLMGGEGQVEKGNVVLNEIHLSAMSEVMNQMIGSAATAMANMMSREVNISPPLVQRATAEDDAASFLDGAPLVIKISFDMEIEGLLKSKLMQIMPVDMGKLLIESLMPREGKGAQKAAVAVPQQYEAAAPSQPRPSATQPQEPKRVQPVRQATYQSFDEPFIASAGDISHINYDLINDIPLQVTVELGKAKKNLNEVLNLGIGSIIVLDKLAGELVDVIVNGKKIAKGEVVVIDDNYGVRITEIIK